VTESPFGEGEAESALPFVDRADARIILLKALDAGSFRSEDFQREGEQDWMAGVGLLAENREHFDARMPVNIGRVLYESLFPKESKVEGLLQQAIKLAERESTQLHLQIMIEADAVQRSRLSDYPWELLHDGKGFLAQRQVSFSRYIAYHAAPPNLPPAEEINVFLVSSAAFDRDNGLTPLSEQEQQAVRSGLDKAQKEGHIRMAEPKSATL
jgi:hypothetical protein